MGGRSDGVHTEEGKGGLVWHAHELEGGQLVTPVEAGFGWAPQGRARGEKGVRHVGRAARPSWAGPKEIGPDLNYSKTFQMDSN
jgi:hypothetical protein